MKNVQRLQLALGLGCRVPTIPPCPQAVLCNLPTLHLVHPPLPLYSCQDTVDPFGEFTSTFRRQKVGAAAAAKFIRLKFAGNYLSK